MSAKELDRLKVLHEVKKRHITQKQAAAELGLRVRWGNCRCACGPLATLGCGMACVAGSQTGKRQKW